MITVQEFMDCYNAAKEGKQVYRRIKHLNHIEDWYEYEDVDFLSLTLKELLYEGDKNEVWEYGIKTWE